MLGRCKEKIPTRFVQKVKCYRNEMLMTGSFQASASQGTAIWYHIMQVASLQRMELLVRGRILRKCHSPALAKVSYLSFHLALCSSLSFPAWGYVVL